MQNLHRIICWMLKKNVGSRLLYDRITREYSLLGQYNKGIVVPENGHINYETDTFYMVDARTVFKIYDISKYSHITEEMYVEIDEDIAEGLCYIMENVEFSRAFYDPISEMFAISVSFSKYRAKTLPKGYAFADNKRRIINEETGKVICRCLPML